LGLSTGNRSALEWILDQYKEKKPKDPTIAENSTITALRIIKSSN
jgi:predicted helicase